MRRDSEMVGTCCSMTFLRTINCGGKERLLLGILCLTYEDDLVVHERIRCWLGLHNG